MELSFTCSAFDNLRPADLYALLKLRCDIFVVEQECPYPECDGIDPDCLHLMGRDSEGRLVAGARIVPPGISYPGFASIGRVVVDQSMRGKGIGVRLMEEALQQCEVLFPGVDIKIMAQTYLKSFYADLGFEPTLEAFLEDEIPHIIMFYRWKK